MNKIIEYEGNSTIDLSLLTSSNRFSFFNISTPFSHNIPLEKQIINFFYDHSSIIGGGSSEHLNSGLRKLHIWVNSLEEYYFLSGYFKDQGFKIGGYGESRVFPKRKARLYFTESNFDPFLYCIYFDVYISKKSYNKFMRSIKELRNIYNYHTLFWKSKNKNTLILE